MTTSMISTLLIFAAILTGCSGKEPESKGKHRELYESVNAPIDKAKAVEADLERAAQQQQREIDQQSSE